MKRILTKKFLKYFAISFLVFMGILLLQFISKYSDDIFTKGFPIQYILTFIFYASLTLIGLGLLSGVFMAAVFSFRYYSSKQEFRFVRELLWATIVIFVISLVFFGYSNWILPKADLEMKALLYDMRKTAPGEKIERSDKNLFKGHYSLMTIKQINLKIDTLNTEIDQYKYQCDSLLGILPDSIAREKYNWLKLDNYGIKLQSETESILTANEVKYSGNYLLGLENRLGRAIIERQKFVNEKTERIVFPIEIILLFIIAASFGYYYNDQKAFLLIILGLYTISFFHGTILSFKSLVSDNILGNTEGIFYSFMILLVVTSVFFILALKKEQKGKQSN